MLSSFKVSVFLDPALAHPTGIYRNILEQVEEKGIRYRQVRRGDVIDFRDGVVFEVMNPPGNTASIENSNELNDSSVVLRVSYGKTAFILSGDASKRVDEDMMQNCPDVRAQVLKVAHHGSSDAATAGWLAAVHPDIAVISVGWKNQFSHPSEKTLESLKAADIKVYRTDQDGGIIISTDGERMHIEAQQSGWR